MRSALYSRGDLQWYNGILSLLWDSKLFFFPRCINQWLAGYLTPLIEACPIPVQISVVLLQKIWQGLNFSASHVIDRHFRSTTSHYPSSRTCYALSPLGVQSNHKEKYTAWWCSLIHYLERHLTSAMTTVRVQVVAYELTVSLKPSSLPPMIKPVFPDVVSTCWSNSLSFTPPSSFSTCHWRLGWI